MTLAFSTSSDSAKAIRSIGFLFLNSVSFISCMNGLCAGYGKASGGYDDRRTQPESKMAMARDGKEERSLQSGPQKSKTGFVAGSGRSDDRSRDSQNGLTTTRMTMAIISTVGISLTIRQCRAGFVFRSSAKRRTAPPK